jgi:fibronectin type 3 domain-containing protein
VRGSRVQLTWADNAGDEAAYVVYRSLDGGETWEPLAELEADATRYVDREVEPGATYAYTVSAGNDAGESWSEPVKVTVD